jgi:hypothetical protein
MRDGLRRETLRRDGSAVGEQRQEASAFDGRLDHALMAGAVSGTFLPEDSGLPAHQALQLIQVLIVNGLHIVTAETATLAGSSGPSCHDAQTSLVVCMEEENGETS